ncbi:MAG: protein kinase [Lentisphaeraceae bacterium]|nr:protein kinase [Lentisphaeraceae bacterium]
MSDISSLDKDDEKLSCFYNMQADDLSSSESRPLFQQISNLKERYFDMEEVGSGGMKKVLKAYDEKSERFVAIARPLKKNDDESIERFLYEARLTASLSHPNIIKVYDLGLDESSIPYFVMELKEGTTLNGLITNNSCSTDELLTSFIKVCDSISFAHSKGIIHLDLKPGNIQIGSHGEVLVCDWGMAKRLDHSLYDTQSPNSLENLKTPHPYVTLDSHIKGTPGFMSPEQASKSQDINKLSDIYGLGAILYFILCGHPPITGETEDVLDKTIKGELLPFKTNIPQGLQAITLRALSKDPKKRYSSVSEMITDINLYFHGFPTDAENANLLHIAKLMIKRHLPLFILTTFFLCLILSSTFMFMNQLKDREKVALIQRDKARNALKKFMDEKVKNEKLINEASTEAVRKVRGFFDRRTFRSHYLPREFHQALSVLKTATMANPKNEKIWQYLGNFNFKIQRFEEASKCYNYTSLVNSQLINLAKQCSILCKEGRLLSPEDFQNLLDNFKVSEYAKSKLATDMLYYIFSKENNINKRKKYLVSVLKTWNIEWQNPIMDIQRNNKMALTIGGPGLKVLTPQSARLGKGNILNLFGITELTIIDSDLNDLQELNSLDLTHLDLSQSNIISLKGLKELKTLTSLTIRKYQFTDLSDISSKVKITEIN